MDIVDAIVKQVVKECILEASGDAFFYGRDLEKNKQELIRVFNDLNVSSEDFLNAMYESCIEAIKTFPDINVMTKIKALESNRSKKEVVIFTAAGLSKTSFRAVILSALKKM